VTKIAQWLVEGAAPRAGEGWHVATLVVAANRGINNDYPGVVVNFFLASGYYTKL